MKLTTPQLKGFKEPQDTQLTVHLNASLLEIDLKLLTLLKENKLSDAQIEAESTILLGFKPECV